jgi:Mg2+ and Co2+ transporter CorA
MKFKEYRLASGKLRQQRAGKGVPEIDKVRANTWFDVENAQPAEIEKLLSPFNLHPLMLSRCIDKVNTPGVISYGKAVLIEYPVAIDLQAVEPAYLTIIFQPPFLITIRHSQIPAFSELLLSLSSDQTPELAHLVQVVYLILDEMTDLSVQAQTDIRDRISEMSKVMAKGAGVMRETDITALRWQVDKLISLIENQLYCVTGLNASDNEALRETHRKAYLEDLVSEVEIALRGVNRLEARIGSLYDSYQMAGSARVEKRLRILTIISAITLPFALIAGLLGMNVGGLPWTETPLGFVIVICLMVFIAAAELWYFWKTGWFD